MIDRTWKRVGHGREREGGGWEKANKKRRYAETIYLHGRHLAEFLTNSCMLVYE